MFVYTRDPETRAYKVTFRVIVRRNDLSVFSVDSLPQMKKSTIDENNPPTTQVTVVAVYDHEDGLHLTDLELAKKQRALAVNYAIQNPFVDPRRPRLGTVIALGRALKSLGYRLSRKRVENGEDSHQTLWCCARAGHVYGNTFPLPAASTPRLKVDPTVAAILNWWGA